MSDGLMVVASLLAVIGLAALILFLRDRLNLWSERTLNRFKKPLGIIASAMWRFVRPALVTVLVIVAGGAVIGGISENWDSLVCWVNDKPGSLSRTCAAHKISVSEAYGTAEIIEITGIADLGDHVKKVEFRWRTKSSTQYPDPSSGSAALLFREYDDGWRIAQ